MKTMKILRMVMSFLLMNLSYSISAQTNDVTKAYFDNSCFDSSFDYEIGDTGNVAQEMLDVSDWIRPDVPNYTIGGVYQFGTSKTFNGVAVPSVAYDVNNPNGGGLALSTGWNQQLTYYHPVTLPVGKYAIVTAIYNCADKMVGKSLVGWIPTSGVSSMSAVSSFKTGEWITDTIKFQITEATAGRLQLGLEAGANGSANSAKIIVDYIKLLRDTPLGAEDVAYRKTVLLSSINTAKSLYGEGSGNDAAILNAAIVAAEKVYDDATDLDEVIETVTKLNSAITDYRYANSTGNIPVVTTDSRYACGSTAAFGRMTITGVTTSEIKEQGFCWSENPMPTISDNKTTRYLSNNGRLFWMSRLTPSTVYYARPYVITTGYALVYGEPVRIVTLPKGKVSYGIRSGFPDDAAVRIETAVKTAVDYWNTYTNINGCYLNVGYGSGTPTAECSYGGWMTVGPNESYQKTGTIMHEALHAIGVGTTWQWYGPDSPLRETGESGLWLGVRATRLLQFWDNDDTANLHGDKMHLWPYGVNGANEDTGTDLLYIGNSLMAEAVCEDGLPPTGGFAVAGHVFEEQANTKYYIKNESGDRGLYSSYLVEDESGNIKWDVVDDISSNDNAAWYMTFNPSDCYYRLCNAATGNYISCSSDGTISMRKTSSPSSTEEFHLLPSHVYAINDTQLKKQGFWIVRPENVASPKCIQANESGKVASAAFNLSDDSKQQRWIIMTSDEAAHVTGLACTKQVELLNKTINNVESLLTVPHTEDIAGSDSALRAVITEAKTTDTNTLSLESIEELTAKVNVAGLTFLAGVTPSDISQPFDLTYMIANASMDSTDGWSEQLNVKYSCMEYYQTQFNVSQEIDNLPIGTYQIKAQAFQRPGSVSNVYTNYLAGRNTVNAYLYVNRDQSKVANIFTGVQNSMLGGDESEVSTSQYIPNDMQSAHLYFDKDLYDNSVVTSLTSEGSLVMGVRLTSYSDYYWTVFDNFRLYYYGSIAKSVITPVGNICLDSDSHIGDIYTLQGVCVKHDATNFDGLSDGVYIVGNKKVIINGK